MFKHIRIFLKNIMCYLIGYIIVAALFAYEYVYYNDSVEQGVYHYANRLLISIIGCSGITYDSPLGKNMEYEHFNRFEKPDGDIVLCTQDAYPMYSMYSGTIYIETAHNTLIEVENYSTFSHAVHNAYWLDDKVRIVVTDVTPYDYDDENPEYVCTDITYEELARIKGSD